MKWEFNVNHLYFLFGMTVAAMVLMNVTMSGHLKEPESQKPLATVKKEPVQKAETDKDAPPPKHRFTHQPSDPKEYGMIVMTPTTTPRSPEQWEIHYRRLFEKNQTLDSDEAREVLHVSRMKPEDYHENMITLDEKIDEIRQSFSHDPHNRKLEKKLQMLYKLKALGKVLRPHILSNSTDPFFEELMQKASGEGETAGDSLRNAGVQGQMSGYSSAQDNL